ncbi:MAG: hypothetical protein EBQ96_00020 [Proteobacteria bacterium]|nr:hypothetical protein [Pseudomonadota bacterium]
MDNTDPTEIELALKALDEGRLDDRRVLDLFIGSDETGRNIFMYVAIPPSKYLDYRVKVERTQAIDIKSCGEVIAWGYGILPPKQLQDEMAKLYGFQHDWENELAAHIEAKHFENERSRI